MLHEDERCSGSEVRSSTEWGTGNLGRYDLGPCERHHLQPTPKRFPFHESYLGDHDGYRFAVIQRTQSWGITTVCRGPVIELEFAGPQVVNWHLREGLDATRLHDRHIWGRFRSEDELLLTQLLIGQPRRVAFAILGGRRGRQSSAGWLRQRSPAERLGLRREVWELHLPWHLLAEVLLSPAGEIVSIRWTHGQEARQRSDAYDKQAGYWRAVHPHGVFGESWDRPPERLWFREEERAAAAAVLGERGRGEVPWPMDR